MASTTSQGLTIAFDDVGAGIPIVLGHSFLCSGKMWREQVPALARSHRVVNVDFRGHGRSGPVETDFTLYDAVADVIAVLDQLQIESAVWCGLSVGGMVALRAALTHPERVQALVLMDTDAGPETLYKKLKYRAMGIGARAFGIGPFLPQIMPLMFGRTTLRNDRELVREWREEFRTLDVPSVLRGLGALMTRDSVLGRLGEIDVPSLVLVGAEDRSLPPGLSHRLHQRLRGSRFAEIPGAGHLACLEQPEAVNEVVLDFLSAAVA